MSNIGFTVCNLIYALFIIVGICTGWTVFIFLFRLFSSEKFNEEVRQDVIDWLNGKKK